MASLSITEALSAGDVIVLSDHDAGTLIVWNYSATFRVLQVDESGRCTDVDAFTNYDATGSITAAKRIAADHFAAEQAG